jgi:hypothetical protein
MRRFQETAASRCNQVIQIKSIAQQHLRREHRLPFLQGSCIGGASSRIQEPRISGTERNHAYQHGCNGAILVQRELRLE